MGAKCCKKEMQEGLVAQHKATGSSSVFLDNNRYSAAPDYQKLEDEEERQRQRDQSIAIKTRHERDQSVIAFSNQQRFHGRRLAAGIIPLEDQPLVHGRHLAETESPFDS